MKALSSLSLLILLFLAGCANTRPDLNPIEHVPQVDISRFMGDWYVIANIPTWIEKGAHNALERYELLADGRIQTTFTYREGGFDGPEKEMRPVGYVADDPSNAIWGMQFIWPFKGDYRIIYLTEDYSVTVIGRQKRDYVWLMARTPRISNQQLAMAKAEIARQGYDLTKLEMVPQGPRR